MLTFRRPPMFFWATTFFITWISLLLGSLEFAVANRADIHRDPAWWSTTGPIAGALLSLVALVQWARFVDDAKRLPTHGALRERPSHVFQPGFQKSWSVPMLCAGCGAQTSATYPAMVASQTERVKFDVPLCPSCMILQKHGNLYPFAIIHFVGFVLSVFVMAWQNGVAAVGLVAAVVLSVAFSLWYRQRTKDRFFAPIAVSGRGWAFTSNHFTQTLLRMNDLVATPARPSTGAHAETEYDDLLREIRRLRDLLDRWQPEEGEARLAALRAEAKTIGEELDCRGGKPFMLKAFEESGANRGIEIAWDGVGDWRG